MVAPVRIAVISPNKPNEMYFSILYYSKHFPSVRVHIHIHYLALSYL